jgi:hypothetical protein
MRRLTIVASLLLVLGLTAGLTAAAPSATSGDDAIVAADDKGDAGAPKAKSSARESYRDKLDSRNKPKQPAEAKGKDKYKPWKEVTKDAEVKEGLFKTYLKDEDVFFSIKEDQLDKPMAIFMNLSKGFGARFVLGGLPLTETIMFDFHREKDHVQVRQLNTRFRAPSDPALEESVDLSYGNSILFNLPIKSENEKDKEILVEMNEVFLSDISDMEFFLQLVLSKPVRMDQKKGIYRKVKVFPKNVEIEVLLTYSPGDRRGLDLPQVPDARFIEIGVAYGIHQLPENPMKPRRADDRVGYFLTPYKDFSKDKNESFFVHNINRWRLEKKDPTVRLSEPVQPITFYIDTTIPEEYRSYVARGIEMWQKAFEAAGFKNGIIAKEVGDDPDFDAEDARYHTIRWIASDEPSFGAIGPSRTDPRTGEIIESDILMEQSMIANFRKAYRRYSGPDAFVNSDPMVRYMKDPKTNPELAALLEIQRRFNNGIGMCDISHGFAMNFDFLQLALMIDGPVDGKGDGMPVPQEYVGEAIMFVTAHEVGHTLGLRHNFKSSISTPYSKLNDKSAVEEIGLTGSVMDYPTPNVSRDRSKQGYYFTPSVGTCDQWSIQFGYTEFSGDLTPEEELAKLKTIADQASEPKHAYGTDEDTYPSGAMDPGAAIWDLGDDPLAWAKERMGVCQDILSNGKLVERVVSENDNYVPLRSAVETILVQEYYAAARAVKYVGGQRTARPHRGDNGGQMSFTPVPASEQKAAMAFITENALSKGSFAVDPKILDQLQDNRLWNWQNNLFDYGRRFDFPLTGWVAAFQNSIVMQLLDPMRLQRMQDAEYKQADAYKQSDLFRTLTSSIWTDNIVATGPTAGMQRNLQRVYLHHLVQMTVNPQSYTPWESIALARLQLTRLRGQINSAFQRSGLSDEANAHLAESLSRIDRALDAKLESSF